jgi:hypothetical protein
MQKSFFALIGAAVIGLSVMTPASHANAGCFGCAVGAGVIGGVAAGAIVGSAIANSPPPPPPPGYYPPPPGYYPPPPGYYPPPPGAAYPPPPAYAQLAPGCHWGRRRVWVDGYGYQWRPVPVCP